MEAVTEVWFAEGLKFKCTGCGKCCTGSPGYVFLSRSDLDRLADHFQLSSAAFARKYTRIVDGQWALLDRKGSADCIFLRDNKCSAYEARPTQCRTYPWWIHNLREKSDWEEEAKHCEGINHVDAPEIPAVVIQEQCLTYLDNLLDQNFTF